ncbi:MAG: methyltransferase domain-containing protein [Gemmatimonadales bacterium]|nr:methyltransferase domain-containing protein [Gemmatimonadales bacterium]NIN11209.1 methyltransferase domain-containing protein [Gemmatimonadales bacterium]NIN49808.1 methyltransferase domain-containing protein [Gemmatimonadales bacterium]NIP07272.1 methyltransferase domain-containing protein [Gemmatimonadales bacterium]NIR02967.1 methyltransferase domain-containing protein [Gemmatimonadales bacterium]
MARRLSPTGLLAILQPWADVAEPIHRRLAQLADAEPGQEVLWVGCGSGRSVLWWAERFRTHIEGVDPDHNAIEAAERASRRADLASLVTFQTATPDDLPHEAQVFDVTIANLLYLFGTDGARILQEAGRVARPMSTVMALVPSWLSTPDPEDARLLGSLGLQPHLLVEWKSFFREAGIVELSVEDAALDGNWIAYGWIGLLIRGWRAARWVGVGMVLSREVRTLRSLARQRVLGLSIVKGTRWPHG